jgi:hypothetical protein
MIGVWVMVFNATFSFISFIGKGNPGEIHRPVASHWQSFIYLLTGHEGIASLLSPRHWLLTEVNSQGRGDNKLVIPEYTVYKYFIIPKNIRLIVEWSPQNDKDQ